MWSIPSKKLPLNNPILRAISCLDPTEPKDSLVMKEFNKLPDLLKPANVDTPEDKEAFGAEVVQYMVNH